MGNGRSFYPCRCGGEIIEEWDSLDNYLECDTCDNPRPLPEIYLIGEAGSGKDYITQLIKGLYPYRDIAIADPLYELADRLKADDTEGFMSILQNLGLNDYQRYRAWKRVTKSMVEEIKDPSVIKPRKSLQKLGDIVRSYQEDALLEGVVRRTIGPTIVSDVRLPSEGQRLRDCGFIGIKVFADEGMRLERLGNRDVEIDKSTLKHKTETQISKVPFDYLIDNTIGEKETLVDRIYEIIKS